MYRYVSTILRRCRACGSFTFYSDVCEEFIKESTCREDVPVAVCFHLQIFYQPQLSSPLLQC